MLAVGATVLDDAQPSGSAARQAAWLYDFRTGGYGLPLNTIIEAGDAPVDVLDVALAGSSVEPIAFVVYCDHIVSPELKDLPKEYRVAVVQGGALVSPNLLSGIFADGRGADEPIDDIRATADGRFVVLQTNARNIVPGNDQDTNGGADLFLIDRQTGRIELISVGGAQVDGDLLLSDVSLDAASTLSIAFYTSASGLAVADSNGADDAYVWRRPSATSATPGASTITLVSATASGAQGGIEPRLSSAGVYFTSASAAYSTADANKVDDVWKQAAGAVSALAPVTLAQDGGPTQLLDLTGDGARMLLLTESVGLLGGVPTVPQLVLFEAATQSTQLLSVAVTGGFADDAVESAVISPDGRRSVFVSKASNLSATADGSAQLLLFDAGDSKAPVFQSATQASAMVEGVVPTAAVYKAVALDTDAVVYSIRSGVDDGALFSIDAVTGSVSFSGTPDFETKPSYRFTVVARDASRNEVAQSVLVPVTDVNEAPTALALANVVAVLPENLDTAQRTRVADLALTDDALGTNTYALSGADPAVFEIVGQSLYLRAGVALDFEIKADYRVTVRATDATISGSPSVTVDARLSVSNQNDPPVGQVTIAGAATAKQGVQLTASGSVTDADGIASNIVYQWLADGKAIAGALGTTFTPGQDQVGKLITVTASYTDALNNLGFVQSPATAAVLNVNDAPSGTVSIVGLARQGLMLTASHGLQDLDGIPTSGDGAIRFQWLANGVAISGANTSSLLLVPALTGKAISVQAGYTDLGNTPEKVSSAPTSAVIAAKVSGLAYEWSDRYALAGTAVRVGEAGTDLQTQAQSQATVGTEGSWLADGLDFERVASLASRAASSTDLTRGVQASDALAAFKLALGRNPNADADGAGGALVPKAVSPYQMIAADTSGDGKLSTDDIRPILTAALKPATATGLSWVFADEREDFWIAGTRGDNTVLGLTRNSIDWARSPSLLADTDSKLNLVGVLRGDVDGSWTPSATAKPIASLGPTYFETLHTALGIPLEQWGLG